MTESLKHEFMDLYYKSKTVQFGAFELSAHRDNPDLEKSPIYLHYPKAGTEEAKLLPRLYEVLGELMVEFLREVQPPVEYQRLAAVPKGAMPLAEDLAKRQSRLAELLTFGKTQLDDGGTVFTGPDGHYEKGDKLLIIEDHTSGGRNKKLIKKAAEDKGLVVTDFLTVVDRQQGGVPALAAIGVRLHALCTLDELLDFGLQANYITGETVEKVRSYIQRNQLYVPEAN